MRLSQCGLYLLSLSALLASHHLRALAVAPRLDWTRQTDVSTPYELAAQAASLSYYLTPDQVRAQAKLHALELVYMKEDGPGHESKPITAFVDPSRNTLIVAVPGTRFNRVADVVTIVQANAIPVDPLHLPNLKAHAGFTAAAEAMYEHLREVLRTHGLGRSIFLTGHSGGSSILAIFLAKMAVRDPELLSSLTIQPVFFGSAIVFDQDVQAIFPAFEILNFIMEGDIVPRLDTDYFIWSTKRLWAQLRSLRNPRQWLHYGLIKITQPVSTDPNNWRDGGGILHLPPPNQTLFPAGTLLYLSRINIAGTITYNLTQLSRAALGETKPVLRLDRHRCGAYIDALNALRL